MTKPSYTLECGDAKELIMDLRDDSVDMIFTDPPYLKEHLGLYGVLARQGYRVLKPGGWLFTYGGSEYIPYVTDVFNRSEFAFFCVVALKHSGSIPRLWYKKLMCEWKPVYAYTKGPPKIVRWMSTMASDERDKRYHKWGQGAGFAVKIISMLTDPGDVILDPFAGGGTTGLVALELGRRFIGYELDPAAWSIASARLANARTPMFVPDSKGYEQVWLPNLAI